MGMFLHFGIRVIQNIYPFMKPFPATETRISRPFYMINMGWITFPTTPAYRIKFIVVFKKITSGIFYFFFGRRSGFKFTIICNSKNVIKRFGIHSLKF